MMPSPFYTRHNNIPLQDAEDAGQAASALGALQVIVDAPLSLYPLLQLNVATLPWLSPLFFDTPPFPGALA